MISNLFVTKMVCSPKKDELQWSPGFDQGGGGLQIRCLEIKVRLQGKCDCEMSESRA